MSEQSTSVTSNRCGCPNGSYGKKHSTACLEAQVRQLSNEVKALRHYCDPLHVSRADMALRECGYSPVETPVHPCDDGLRTATCPGCSGKGCDYCNEGLQLVRSGQETKREPKGLECGDCGSHCIVEVEADPPEKASPEWHCSCGERLESSTAVCRRCFPNGIAPEAPRPLSEQEHSLMLERVAQLLGYDKAVTWWQTSNPLLGGVRPWVMALSGATRARKLYRFIEDAFGDAPPEPAPPPAPPCAPEIYEQCELAAYPTVMRCVLSKGHKGRCVPPDEPVQNGTTDSGKP